MGALNTEVGKVDYDNLVISGGAVGTIQLAAGQGTLERGSVLDSDGKLLTADGTAKFILCDDTETDDTDPVTGTVYKTGVYIRNSLVVAEGYSLSDEDVEELRDVGIIVESAK